MKKLLSIILIIGLSFAIAEATAKTNAKKKSSTKSTVAAPANVTVAKNYDGFPDPTGHVYRGKGNGITMTFDFDGRRSMTITTTYKKDKVIESWGWEQDGYRLYIMNEWLVISDDGRVISAPEGVEFYIVR